MKEGLFNEARVAICEFTLQSVITLSIPRSIDKATIISIQDSASHDARDTDVSCRQENQKIQPGKPSRVVENTLARRKGKGV